MASLLPGRLFPGAGVLVGLNVLHHDLPALVDVISVKARDVS